MNFIAFAAAFTMLLAVVISSVFLISVKSADKEECFLNHFNNIECIK